MPCFIQTVKEKYSVKYKSLVIFCKFETSVISENEQKYQHLNSQPSSSKTKTKGINFSPKALTFAVSDCVSKHG